MRGFYFITAFVSIPAYAWAQHEGHAPPPSVEPSGPMETTRRDEPRDHEMPSGALGLPMTRWGSGTAWLPDDLPMRALQLRGGGWRLMLHGNVHVGYDAQAGDAGDEQLVSQNWLMAMASRPFVGGHFMVRGMLSLEPLTVGKSGYPLLLQNGEAVDGRPIVDRQHPHDLIMEAAIGYERAIGDDVAVKVYTALAGEPALGPVAFPHRPSAMTDPIAPLGHHWQDSTHIAFGVVTAGVFTRRVKLEASWFNGREPDDERYDIEFRGFDSGSARITVNPDAHWSMQASAGYLDSPELLEPGISIVRTTASVMHAQRYGRRLWTSTLAWGRNTPTEGPATDSLLAETVLDLHHLGATFVRAEYVAKTGHDLALDPALDDAKFGVGMLSLGHTHPVLREGGFETALGVRGSAGIIDDDLQSRYGTRFPLGVMAYVQLQPQIMQHRATPHAARTASAQ